MKSHSEEQVNLLGSCFTVKGMHMKEMFYAVRCLKSNEDMILALTGQFKQLSHVSIVSYYIPFTGKHEPNKLTCSQLCDFIAQLDCTGIAEVMGSNPVESPEFFRFMRQLLKLSSKCEDHILI